MAYLTASATDWVVAGCCQRWSLHVALSGLLGSGAAQYETANLNRDGCGWTLVPMMTSWDLGRAIKTNHCHGFVYTVDRDGVGLRPLSSFLGGCCQRWGLCMAIS